MGYSINVAGEGVGRDRLTVEGRARYRAGRVRRAAHRPTPQGLQARALMGANGPITWVREAHEDGSGAASGVSTECRRTSSSTSRSCAGWLVRSTLDGWWDDVLRALNH